MIHNDEGDKYDKDTDDDTDSDNDHNNEYEEDHEEMKIMVICT